MVVGVGVGVGAAVGVGVGAAVGPGVVTGIGAGLGTTVFAGEECEPPTWVLAGGEPICTTDRGFGRVAAADGVAGLSE